MWPLGLLFRLFYRTLDINTCCRAFGSETVTTCLFCVVHTTIIMARNILSPLKEINISCQIHFWMCTIISWFISMKIHVISMSDVKQFVHQKLKHLGNHRLTNSRVEVRISGFFEVYNFFHVLCCILRLFWPLCTMNAFHICTMKSCKIWSDMMI